MHCITKKNKTTKTLFSHLFAYNGIEREHALIDLYTHIMRILVLRTPEENNNNKECSDVSFAPGFA